MKFSKGHIRLPGTRELDPVKILEVRDAEGNVIFTQGEPETRQVVNAGSVWLLDSIMMDCKARWIIWGCGTDNDDLRLDSFMTDGQEIPTGVKTGTQQGPLDADDTLETWMTGYSRYAANVVWVGNANNALVQDGPQANYAAANTTVWLFKNWMGEYHDVLQARGLFSAPANFDDLEPDNVAQRSILSPTTEQDRTGGCNQYVTSWIRIDITYENPCVNVEIDTRTGNLANSNTPNGSRVTRLMPRLPDYRPDLALELARKLGIGGYLSQAEAADSGHPVTHVRLIPRSRAAVRRRHQRPSRSRLPRHRSPRLPPDHTGAGRADLPRARRQAPAARM